MGTATANSSGEVIARVFALILGLVILFYMYLQWGDQMQNLFASNGETTQTQMATPVAAQLNPGLRTCLEKRLGDVDKMLDEGIISDKQHASFAQRAEGLCMAQNPSN